METVKTDAEIIDWLQRVHTFHTQVDVVRLANGYAVLLMREYETMYEFHGETLREAYAAAMAVEYDESGCQLVKRSVTDAN